MNVKKQYIIILAGLITALMITSSFGSEIIVKSSDTLDDVIDEQQLDYTYSLQIGVPTTINTVRQGFIPDLDYCSKIDIYVHSGFSSGSTVYGGVGYTTSTFPFWEWLGYEIKTSLPSGWNSFDFSNFEYPFSPDSQYYIQIYYSGSSHINVGWMNENPYQKGNLWTNYEEDRINDDLAFKVWGYDQPPNQPPLIPDLRDGPHDGFVGVEYQYRVNAWDRDEDEQLQYRIDWDGEGWSNWNDFNNEYNHNGYTKAYKDISHTWDFPFEGDIEVQSRDDDHAESPILYFPVSMIVEPPELSYSPSSIHFETHPQGWTGYEIFEVWNSGGQTLYYTISESISWLDVNPTSGSSTGEYDIITVEIENTNDLDGYYSGYINIDAGDAGNGEVFVDITIYEEPVIQLTPSSHDFGQGIIDEESDEFTFTLKNIGGGTAQGDVSLTGTNPNQFVITQGDGTFHLGEDQTKPIKVKFSPTSTGYKNARLLADATNCEDDDSDLYGEGISSPPYLELSPAVADYPYTHVGEVSSPQYFTLINSGDSTATGDLYLTGTDPNQFNITMGAGPFSLNPDEHIDVEVTFNPTIPGDKIAILKADGDSSCNDDTSTLTGHAIGNPPETPIIEGPTYGYLGANITYTIVTVDPDPGDSVFYRIDWDDGADIDWIGLYPSGGIVEVDHKYTSTEQKNISVQAKDMYGYESSWSEPYPVTILDPYDIPHYAVVIGEWDYPGNEDDIIASLCNVESINTFLRNTNEWTNIKFNTNHGANGIIDDLTWMIDQEDETSISLFYYSGHGTQITDDDPDEEADGKDEAFYCSDGSTLRDDDLKDLLDQFEGPVVVILETCNAGGMPAILRGDNADNGLLREIGGNNTVIMAACNENEDAHVGDGMYSVFTNYIRIGWNGEADDGDDKITDEETFNYARDKTLEYAQGQPWWQEPQFIDGYGGEIPLIISGFNQNLAPDLPINPSPYDGEENIPLETDLSCYVTDPNNDNLTVGFFWSDGTLIGIDFDVLSGEQASITVTGLEPGLTYEWYVLSSDGMNITTSPIWHFITNTSGMNFPPYMPNNPHPIDGASGIAVNTDLRWLGGDPNPNDNLIYDVYFGTSSNPSYVDSVAIESYNPPGLLDYETTYYWKIVARDGVLSTIGPVWSFSTCENSQPDIPSNPNPSDGAIDVNTNPTLSVFVSDPDEDLLDVNFYGIIPGDFIIDSETDWNNGILYDVETNGNGNLILSEIQYFGDGSDGEVVIPSYTKLTRDMNYQDLSINSGATLDTAGYTVRVTGTLINNGIITDSVSGGNGGLGGSGGRGADPKQNSDPIGPENPENGDPGCMGFDGIISQAGGGGCGAGGGGGGGGAWKTLGTIDADGGDGGQGGSGGKGGGYVEIYAFNFDNNGQIHANGEPGEDGQDGMNGEHYPWPEPLPTKDLSGGGGGAGGGGNGGNGGTVEVFCNNLMDIGDIQANGGLPGNGGIGGDGHQLSLGVVSGDHSYGANGNANPNDGGDGGDGGQGEHRKGYSSGNGDEGLDGAAGEIGDTILSILEPQYIAFGEYYQIFDAEEIVDWTSSNMQANIPSGTTDVTVSYAANTSGSWIWYANIIDIPDSRWLQIKITLSTTDLSISPSVDSLFINFNFTNNLSYQSNVISNSVVNCTWVNLESLTTYHWKVIIDDDHGGISDAIFHFTTELVQSEYVCGDANGDEAVNVGDAVYIINYVFKGGPLPNPLCRADANGDGTVNVGDAVYLINYVFKGGSPPVNYCCNL